MTRYRIFPYKQGSKSAKLLAEELGGKVLRLQGSTFVPRLSDVIINWGSKVHPSYVTHNYYYKDVSNKLMFFLDMEDALWLPPFWTLPDDIPDTAFPVVCRTVLNGHSGEGIVIAHTREDLVDCQLYVQYIRKKHEYRVHVGRDRDDSLEAISVQRKARRLSVPPHEVNWTVRNLAGGFVYVRGGFTVPSEVEKAAIECLCMTGLDFGAVDVIWNEQLQKAYVLEVNTAPGLEGQTVKDYGDFFRRQTYQEDCSADC